METGEPLDYLILGANGQVGRELSRALQPFGHGRALGRAECDLAHPGAVAETVHRLKPKVVVNAAAWTAVDRAEEEPDRAHRLNAGAVAELAGACAESGAALVHYSTDYVFEGSGETPHGIDAPLAPRSVYGRTKLEGERAIAAAAAKAMVLRTSWVYAAHGHNFVRTMLRVGRERDQLKVIDDQIGAPTWAATIADTTALALHDWRRSGWADDRAGSWHLTAAGAVSWHGFAVAIFEEAVALGIMGADEVPQVVAIPSGEYPQPAPRPANSRLDIAPLEQRFELRMPHWRDALRQCMRALEHG
ncbi:dTDP-4-dehydrorhamnose reductase [Kushneria aurantia]|nr:dTDP-4-dehydrorhamnose reductase [Kushneria aurantia]